MANLQGKTYIVTGASRGIGRAIALRLAREGCNLVIASKTVDDTDQKLKGTIHSVAKEVEEAGGNALAIKLDVRHEEEAKNVIDETVAHFGGLDGLINNAGAIKLMPVEHLPMKRFDLLWQVNVRGAYMMAHHAIPHLRKAAYGHVINMSPPISIKTRWISGKTGYTITKYGMSMLTIGLADELASDGVSAASLWPRTTIATAAVDWLGGEAMMKQSRKPEIMADAIYEIVSTDDNSLSGQHLIDEDFLRERGYEDFEKYAYEPGNPLVPDFYIDEDV